MNWYKIVISQAIINTLREKGVDDDILNYLSTIPNDIKGRLIYILTLYPHLNVHQLIDIHENIYKSDPTVRKSYYIQILQWLQESTIRLPEDSERIFKALSHYHNNKNNYTSKNIQDYQRFQILEQEYRKLTNQISKREELRNLKHSGSKKIYEDERWSLIDILTPEAASYYGKNTTWCTSGDSEECRQTAEDYIEGGLYIILDKKNNTKYQATHDFTQIMNEQDESINYVFNTDKQNIKSLYEFLLKIFPNSSILNYLYAENVIEGRFPQGEQAISKDAKDSYYYAINVLNSRFKLGEESISKNSSYAFMYAKNVIAGRFHEGEEAIAQDANLSYHYAKDLLHSRFKLGEKSIAKYNNFSFAYARDVIGGRFPQGENAISQDAEYAYSYSISILKGRFPEGEKAISESSYYSYRYAKDLLHSRFKLGEKAIYRDIEYRKEYCEHFNIKPEELLK